MKQLLDILMCGKKKCFNIICVHTHFHVVKQHWEISEFGSNVSAENGKMWQISHIITVSTGEFHGTLK